MTATPLSAKQIVASPLMFGVFVGTTAVVADPVQAAELRDVLNGWQRLRWRVHARRDN